MAEILEAFQKDNMLDIFTYSSRDPKLFLYTFKIQEIRMLLSLLHKVCVIVLHLALGKANSDFLCNRIYL